MSRCIDHMYVKKGYDLYKYYHRMDWYAAMVVFALASGTISISLDYLSCVVPFHAEPLHSEQQLDWFRLSLYCKWGIT